MSRLTALKVNVIIAIVVLRLGSIFFFFLFHTFRSLVTFAV